MASVGRALEKAGFPERLTMTSLLLLSRVRGAALALPVQGSEWHDKTRSEGRSCAGQRLRRAVQCDAMRCGAVWCGAVARKTT